VGVSPAGSSTCQTLVRELPVLGEARVVKRVDPTSWVGTRGAVMTGTMPPEESGQQH